MTSGLVLAAGNSSRMGRCKALLPWRGATAIEAIVETLRVGGCARVIVVTGRDHEIISPLAEARGAGFVRNSQPERGMFSSIQTGLRALAPGENFLLALVDQPAITSALVTRLISRPHAIVQPIFNAAPGHP